MSHTPGPWAWDEWDGHAPLGELPSLDYLWGGLGESQRIVLSGVWHNDDTASVGIRSDDDARLIAAAPDLLAALKAMLAQYGYLESAATNLMDAAIAKAEGR